MPAKPGRQPEPLALEPEAWLASQFVRPASATAGLDYMSLDGRVGIQLKASVAGARDLHAAIMHMAIVAEGTPALRRVWLVALDTKISEDRLSAEWQQLLGVLRADLARRVGALVFSAAGAWTSGPLGALEPLRAWSPPHRGKSAASGTRRDALPSAKFFDVWKVLFQAWLRDEGPVSIQALQAQSGAAYPTVADAVKRLEHRNELTRSTNRSVALNGWPRATMSELVPLLPALRRTVWFADQSGRGTAPDWLLKRVRKVASPRVALGGIEAARALDPSFDLVGLPRLDLTVHVPRGEDALGFVHKLDPALAPCPTEHGALLAIHHLTRAEALFAARKGDLPLADPGEIVLDVTELRLGEQRDALVRKLREGV